LPERASELRKNYIACLLEIYPPDNKSAAEIRGDLWNKVTPTPNICFVKAFSGIA